MFTMILKLILGSTLIIMACFIAYIVIGLMYEGKDENDNRDNI